MEGVSGNIEQPVIRGQEDQLQEAKKSLPLGSSAAPILKKAEEDLRQRNKLVKLADKSEAGWLAVDEYLADDLAEDSEDDKKIRSAQSRAAARKKKTDASNIGCGAWMAQCGELKFFQNWKCNEIGKSSTWRELKGVSLAMEAFSPSLKGKKVKVLTDNTGVEVIMRKGSMKVDLHNLALRIADFCNSLPLEVSVQWVPRDENVEADVLSRQEDFDDWGVTVEFGLMNTISRMRTTFSILLCILNCRITSDHKSLQEVLMAFRATSTVAKYRKAFEDWKSWCATNCVCELPAQKADIARYYMSMYNNDAPYSRIEGAHFGIKWFLDCSPVTEVNPCNSRFSHLLLAGLKRILAHPKCKKEPITPDILNKLYNYTRHDQCRDLFKAALSSIGLDSSYFGLHSLRAGGASAAAAIGISDRLFKKHGRWKSDSAKDGYVEESLKNQLSGSLNLGI
eukprot:XP_011669160.1 PREDICTED: uncharacterized protein LOC105440556 [Strongylocentrotus purpuratus]